MDSVVTPCKVPSLMYQEHERECEHLCQMEFSGRKSSFSVKSRDPGAKSSFESCIIFISWKGELMKGGWVICPNRQLPNGGARTQLL